MVLPFIGEVAMKVTVEVVGRLVTKKFADGALKLISQAIDTPLQLGSTKITFPEAPRSEPTVAATKSRLYFAWRGEDDRIVLIWYAGTSRGYYKCVLAETTPSAPAIACTEDSVFLAWQGTDQGSHLTVMELSPDLVPRKKAALAETSPSGPALVVHKRMLRRTLGLAWRGSDDGHLLNVATLTPEGKVEAKHTMPGDWSHARPSIAADTKGFYLAWQGGDDRRSLNTLMMPTFGPDVSQKLIWEETTEAGPTITTNQDMKEVSVAWISGPDHKIKIASLESKLIVQLNETSHDPPALGSYGRKLYVSWRGTGDDHSLNVIELRI